jgi:hypothetical protein
LGEARRRAVVQDAAAAHEEDAVSDEVFGPIDLLVLEFPDGTDASATAAETVRLADLGVVRIYDVLAVRVGAGGAAVEIDLTSDGEPALAGFRSLAGARSGLLGDDDLLAAADILDPGTVAVVLLFENSWAVPFVAAARGEGGQMVATSRLTAQEIMDALDAVEAAS